MTRVGPYPFPRLVFLGIALLALAGCGGGSDDDDAGAVASAGFFYDSTVDGLNFSTPSRAGRTDADGRFLYTAGEPVSFRLCAALLGSATGRRFLSPLEIVAGAADVNDRRVTNIARLLLGLDDDGNSSNGIRLPQSLCSGFPGSINFDVAPADFRTANPDLDAYLTNNGRSLPSASAAQTHMTCSRQDVDAGRRPDGICGAIPTLSINDVTATEGNSGSKAFNFSVSLSSVSQQVVTVNFATADGTATAGSDYVAASGSLSFAAGETSKTIVVMVSGDGAVEPDETFFVNLSGAANATIADGQGLGTITNDDAAPGQSTFSIDDVTAAEGNSGSKTFTFTVTRAGDTGIIASVDVTTADDSATVADGDYAALATTTLSFAAGETSKPVNVTVNGDTKVENNEQFFVNLSNASGNASIVDGQGLGTINNDDSNPPPPPPGGPQLCDPVFGAGCVSDIPVIGPVVQGAVDELAGGSAPVPADNASCASSHQLGGGRSYPVQITSGSDQVISFQVLEPKGGIQCAPGAHPLILHGHGFGGSRSTTGFDSYRDAGYAVISIDQRGFGQSSGTVRTMDPDFEGKDLVRILDWAEANLDYLAYRNEGAPNAPFVARPASGASTKGGVNLVAGAIGSSYGGGYQLLLHAVDELDRLDALVPDITWHDLRWSLNPGDVLKSGWDLLLTAGGEAGSYPPGLQNQELPTQRGLDPYIKEILVRGIATGEFPRESLEWFRYHSPTYWCGLEGNDQATMPYNVPAWDPLDPNMMLTGLAGDVPGSNKRTGQPAVDVLLTQGMRDTLFNFNDVWWNYQCLRMRAGSTADVRVFTHQSGHILTGFVNAPGPLNFENSGGNGNCGTRNRNDATLEWFEQKLRGVAAQPGDILAGTEHSLCLSLSDDDAVDIPVERMLAPRAPSFTPQLAQGTSYYTVDGLSASNVTEGLLAQAQHFIGMGGPKVLPLFEVTDTDGLILAGIPQVSIQVSSAQMANDAACEAAPSQLPTLRTGCDSIVYLGIGIRRAGESNWALVDDQVLPVRGLGRHEDLSLVGVAERLLPGDAMALLVYGYHPQYVVSYTRDITLPIVNLTASLKLPLYAVGADDQPEFSANPADSVGAIGTPPPPPPTSRGLVETLFGTLLGLLGQDNPVTEQNCVAQGSQVDPSGGDGAEQFCAAVFGVPAPPQSNEECRAAAAGTPFPGDQANAFCDAVFGPPAPGNATVMAGVGVVDMTPDVGYGAGQYSAKSPDTPTGEIDPYATHKTQRKSYGVASRLTARALVVQGSNGKRIALVKSDNYLAQDNLMRRVGQILAEHDSSISYEQILHQVTHAHSTTYVSTLSAGAWAFQDAYDLRFFENQARKLAQAILTAERNMKPARMGATTVRHKIFKGQIVGPTSADDGTPAGYPSEYGDHGLVVMRFDEVNASGDVVGPIAAWVNWGEHPEGLDGYDLHSADFVAYLERFVERDLGAPLVFSQGDVGSAEKSGNDQQRLRADGSVCQGPGASGPACVDGEGVWRDWNHKGYVQNERNVRYLADAVVKGWKVIGDEMPVDAPVAPGQLRPNNYVTTVQVPVSRSFPVDYRNAWVPGPVSHPYPSVSNCRTEPTIEGNTGVPVVGLPDCERTDFPGDNPISSQLAQVVATLKAEGLPVPAHYDAPGFVALEENLRLMLQAFRVGDVVLGSCACEAQVDLILNFETRADDVPGNIYDGFDWACVAEDKAMPGFVPRDPAYTAACALQREQYYDVDEFPTHVPGSNFSVAAIKRMRAQVHNDARGWDKPENALAANTEPTDITKIWGNFTKEELAPNRGYKLAVGIGHAGDYNGYTVSYREYMRGDHYRKALTSYGPHTADYMVTRLVRMAGAMKGAPELAAEPLDSLAQADEIRQVALTEAHGQATQNAYEAYFAILPPDIGPRMALEQPKDTPYFKAANFSWRGGSTAVDNPMVIVERCENAQDRDCTGGQWERFADQTGEVQTRVQWPEGIPGVVETYAGQHEWKWTANFEAFEAFPAWLDGTPAGFYRFVVNGCINDGSAPDTNVSNRVMRLLGMADDSACRGGSSAYSLTSSAFEVIPQAELVNSVQSDANGNLSITVSPISIPRTYTSVFPYILAADADADPGGGFSRNDNGNYCEQCSFRPWAASTAAPSSVTVTVNGQSSNATGSGTDWTANVGLALGQTALVRATYADGRASRMFSYMRAGTPPPSVAAGGYGDGLLGAIAQYIARLQPVISTLLLGDVQGAGTLLVAAVTEFLDTLGGMPDSVDPARPGTTLVGLADEPIYMNEAGEPGGVVVQALSANRKVEPVVLKGAQLAGWTQPAAVGVSQNHFSGFENFEGATNPGHGPRDAHAGVFLYPPNWTPGDAPVNQGGADVGKIAAWVRRNGAWQEIPVQVDERYPYFLANGNSTFSFYSGIDTELSYAWDVESWGMTKGSCRKEYDPAGIDVAPKPGIYTPFTPGADPNRGVSRAIPDPIAGLDNDDEIVFMASDAGELYQGTDFPASWQAVQMVRLNDPLNPAAGGFVYLVQQDGGSSFSKDNGYVKYQRHANADQWIDRSFFENGGVEQDPYKRNALGTSNTSYGSNLDGTVCPGWNPGTPNDNSTARPSTALGSDGGDRFPRDGVVVSTDTYRWEATGRWMLRDLRVREPGVSNPDASYWASRPDLVDRWKGRAFQQSPDSTISVVGFEDEQVNWEANSTLLGERCGPVRCMREVWGADSGTNVTKVETFYRDAIAYRYYVRVHPIPPDGLYTSWDYNRAAMLPSDGEKALGVQGGRYYTMLRPQGVPIDGVNDDVGQMDVFPGCRQFYGSEASGTLLPVLAQITNGIRPVADQIPFVGTPDPYELQSCAAFFDAADPSFNLALGFENWEQVSGKGNSGSLVYIFEMTGPTSAANPLVVPYYRDDACLDDGTGDDPVQRPWPGESYAWNNGEVGKTYNFLATGSREGPLVDCEHRQGAYAAHGVHYFFTHDTDNAMTGVTTTEIDGQQWQIMVPTDAPKNVAEPYANTVRARLVPVVIPMSPPGGGGVTPPNGLPDPPGGVPPLPPVGTPPTGGGGWVGDPAIIGIHPDDQCGSLLGFMGCRDDLPF